MASKTTQPMSRFGPANEFVRLVRKNCRTLLDNVEAFLRASQRTPAEQLHCQDAMVRLAMGREAVLLNVRQNACHQLEAEYEKRLKLQPCRMDVSTTT